MRVAVYCRVSTQEQAMNGLSLTDQEQVLRKWVDDNQYTFVGAYIDAGISARKSAKNRPELQRLLRDVEAGRVDLIIFTKLDRWFRNVGQYYIVQNVLDAHGVGWKAILEDYDTTTAAGRLKLNILLSVNQDEADRTSERLKFTFAQMRERGEVTNGHYPLGMKLENKRLVVAENAYIVRDIFSWYISSRSITYTLTQLIEVHHINYTNKAIRFILHNESYRKYGIVSEADWTTAQAILKERSPRTGNNGRIYLFSGLTKCAECGYTMSAHCNHERHFYQCQNYWLNKRCTHHSVIAETTIERYLIANLIDKIEQHNILIEQQPKKSVDLAAIKARQDRLTDLYLNELINRDKYEKEFKTLQQQIEAAPVLARPIEKEKIITTLELYGDLSPRGKKEFWNRVIRTITIDKDKNISFELLY